MQIDPAQIPGQTMGNNICLALGFDIDNNGVGSADGVRHGKSVAWYTLSMKTFSQKVVEMAVKIPFGKVTTYGRLAGRAGGGAMSSQSISGILWKAQEKDGKKIPWHRIVYANGKIWIDDAHRAVRMKLYKQEKIEIDAKGRIKDFEEKLWNFK